MSQVLPQTVNRMLALSAVHEQGKTIIELKITQMCESDKFLKKKKNYSFFSG